MLGIIIIIISPIKISVCILTMCVYTHMYVTVCARMSVPTN